jgi:hypothetical protein
VVFDVEPAAGGWVDGFDGDVFFGFEATTEGDNAVFDEVEAGAGHDVVLGVVGGGDDFLGHAEGGANFCAARQCLEYASTSGNDLTSATNFASSGD